MRCFIAIDLSEETKKEIDKFQKVISPSVHLRMVAPKNLHLTLVFLGEIEEARVRDRIREIVEEVARETKPFNLSLGKPEFFPKWGDPRGLWINLEGEIEELVRVQQKLATKLKEEQFVLERQDFSAHVTVGRSKGKSERLEFAPFRKVEFTVSSLTLFSSKLTPKGPMYGKIAEIGLR